MACSLFSETLEVTVEQDPNRPLQDEDMATVGAGGVAARTRDADTQDQDADGTDQGDDADTQDADGTDQSDDADTQDADSGDSRDS
ncbi:hypothetical protein [Haloactinomyces albus]|uniref:Uncharacterized protein n=1 Tax=Haloactinomyces albus TaxID=1352928 RepID=A0AAE3ZG61_9ACTN|nr:hypothetical protein [Haloactinomyces albus]MDR7304308.1 hypothetical protein [Haloactinomyces albus]